jgi:polar amino acid transport system substrate-binding protein
MKKIKIIFLLAMAALIFAGCEKNKNFASLADFEGAKIASLSGSIFADYVNKAVPNVEHKFFNNTPDIVAALLEGKVDAAALDMPVAKYFVKQNSEIVIFPEAVDADRYGFAVAKGSELGVKGNEALQKLKENGTIEELENIWFSDDDSKKVLPALTYKKDFDGSSGIIKYACDATTVPMSYMDSDGKPIGFDLDIISRIAYELNMKIEFTPMDFSKLLPSLASEKFDMAGGSMSITKERLKSVDFIGPYCEGGIVLVVKKERIRSKKAL